MKKINKAISVATVGFLALSIAGLVGLCSQGEGFDFWFNGARCKIQDRKDVVLQQGKSDCGPAALMNVFNHYGIESTILEIETFAGTTDKGTSMLGLKKMAEIKGLKAQGWIYNWGDFVMAQKPVIAFVWGNHYVVVEESDETSVQMIDPSLGRIKIRSKKFRKIWQGETLKINRAEPGRLCPDSSRARHEAVPRLNVVGNYRKFEKFPTERKGE